MTTSPALVEAQRVEGFRAVAALVGDLVVATVASDCRPTPALVRTIYIDDWSNPGAGNARPSDPRLYLAAEDDIRAFHFVRSI